MTERWDPPPFTSDLIGSYKPNVSIQDEENPNPYSDIFINATWKDPQNPPTIDMSAVFGQPVSIDMMLMLTSGIIPPLYEKGLDHFNFNNDGTFSFGYHGLVDLANLEFTEEVFTFPSPETEQLVPAGAITYYTQNGLLYFAVSKKYLNAIGQEKLGAELTPIIEGIITEYKLENSIVSSEEYFALPLKYTIGADGVVTIKVDLAMMKPFMPVFTQVVLPLLPETAEFDMGMGPMEIPARKVVGELLDGLLNQTSALEIGIRLAKK